MRRCNSPVSGESGIPLMPRSCEVPVRRSVSARTGERNEPAPREGDRFRRDGNERLLGIVVFPRFSAARCTDVHAHAICLAHKLPCVPDAFARVHKGILPFRSCRGLEHPVYAIHAPSHSPSDRFTATNPVPCASPIAPGSATKDGELSMRTRRCVFPFRPHTTWVTRAFLRGLGCLPSGPFVLVYVTPIGVPVVRCRDIPGRDAEVTRIRVSRLWNCESARATRKWVH